MLAMTGLVSDLPDALPMVVDLDTSFHFRREGSGLLVGFNWPHPTPGSPDDPPMFDFDFLAAIADPAVHRLPLLELIGFDSKRSWAGYYAETPDKHAIIGEVDGLFIATGFGGHGIMHSPAAGKAIAQLVLAGKSEIDVFSLRPSRFAEGDLIVESMVI
jgi:sarcosine oxidase subunit beta